jgi:hypothetical protein
MPELTLPPKSGTVNLATEGGMESNKTTANNRGYLSIYSLHALSQDVLTSRVSVLVLSHTSGSLRCTTHIPILTSRTVGDCHHFFWLFSKPNLFSYFARALLGIAV